MSTSSSLKIIHLRARIHRFYRFKKGQFFVVVFILLTCLIFAVTFIAKAVTYPDAEGDSLGYGSAYDDGDDEGPSSITFYERMMQDYKDEISSAEDLQLKVMNEIIKDSLSHMKKNKKGRHHENRVNLAEQRNKKKMEKIKRKHTNMTLAPSALPNPCKKWTANKSSMCSSHSSNIVGIVKSMVSETEITRRRAARESRNPLT